MIKTHGLERAIDRFPEVYLTCHNGMKALNAHHTSDRTEKPLVIVAFGASGSGKTRWCAEQFPRPYFLACHGGEGQTDFFGDYRPRYHETLVVDDFYSNWKFTTFLRACDRYPMEVQTKGGFLKLLANYIVFTSNLHPFDWYPKVLSNPDRFPSFDRRIDVIVEFFPTFYIVRRGNLPFALPHLREATWLEKLQHPWRPGPRQPTLVTGMEPPLAGPHPAWQGNAHVLQPADPPNHQTPHLMIALPPSPPRYSPPQEQEWQWSDAAVQAPEPVHALPLVERLRQQMASLQRDVELMRNRLVTPQVPIASSESFLQRRNDWNQQHRRAPQDQ